MEEEEYLRNDCERLSMLQLSYNIISKPILDAMQPYIQFYDADSDLKDVIYSGMVFDEITDTLADELSDEHSQPSIPLMYVEELKLLNSLGKKCDYIMVIDNPR